MRSMSKILKMGFIGMMAFFVQEALAQEVNALDQSPTCGGWSCTEYPNPCRADCDPDISCGDENWGLDLDDLDGVPTSTCPSFGGAGSCDNCPDVHNPSQADCDCDGIGDACDTSCDPTLCSPGICQIAPCKCEDIVRPNEPTDADSDSDGIANACDNCPSVANPDQNNADTFGGFNDTIGDACDSACADGETRIDGGITQFCENGTWRPADGEVTYAVCTECTPGDRQREVGMNDIAYCRECGPKGQWARARPCDDCESTNTDQILTEVLTLLPGDVIANGHLVDTGELIVNANIARRNEIDSTELFGVRTGGVFTATSPDVFSMVPIDDCKDTCEGSSKAAKDYVLEHIFGDPDGNGQLDVVLDVNEDGEINYNDLQFYLTSDDDGDGIPNKCDQCPNTDLSKTKPDETTFDYDLEKDDGKNDSCTTPNTDPCRDGGVQDVDGDGLDGECDNCPIHYNPDQANEDNDVEGDVCDEDCESCCLSCCCTGPGCPSQDVCYDGGDQNHDTDALDDECDNCIFVKNPSQLDTDNDSIGNACDNCPDTPNLDQADADDDGIGDVCEVEEGGDPQVIPECTGADNEIPMTQEQMDDLCLTANDMLRFEEGLPVNDCDGNPIDFLNRRNIRSRILCRFTAANLLFNSGACDCALLPESRMTPVQFAQMALWTLLISVPYIVLRKRHPHPALSHQGRGKSGS